MTAREALEVLHAAGGSVSIDSGRLRVKAPQSALTPEVRAAIREHGAEIIRLASGSAVRYPLAVHWAAERGWLRVRDPFGGSWHEVLASQAPQSWLDEATSRKDRRN